MMQALDQKRLFVQDYYDIFLPYINKINAQKGRVMYAPRTVLFLTKDNILLPLAIELALPPSTPGGQKNSRVFTPKQQKDGVWPLAKAHVASVDTSFHEVVSHFMRTHACIEPFIIATNRQLSVLHPIHEVLSPHYKNTMDINQAARKALVCADGIIEDTFTPGQYTMEMSSVVYKLDWQFDQQSLPEDLIKRGMAERDPKSPHGIKLVISDYPYAADGLELWAALKDYMTDHIKLFYKNDKAVVQDTELQSWWTEAKTVGHGDKKDHPGWPTLNSIENLAYTLTTIAWVASCHHAAVNFGQYPYGGFMPNRPSMTRKLIPEQGTAEYKDLSDPKKWEKAFLALVSSQLQATIVMGTLEILSTHALDEEYLGQRVTPNWSDDPKVVNAFNKFSQRIKDVEQLINDRNADKSLKNRTGPVQLPYGLLHPTSPTPGLTGTGVPYSISI
jgi:linoleate 9S-lipoxygenase